MTVGVKLSQVFVKTLYHRLIRAGYSPREAGELIAKLIELAANEKGMSIKEIMNKWTASL